MRNQAKTASTWQQTVHRIQCTIAFVSKDVKRFARKTNLHTDNFCWKPRTFWFIETMLKTGRSDWNEPVSLTSKRHRRRHRRVLDRLSGFFATSRFLSNWSKEFMNWGPDWQLGYFISQATNFSRFDGFHYLPCVFTAAAFPVRRHRKTSDICLAVCLRRGTQNNSALNYRNAGGNQPRPCN